MRKQAWLLATLLVVAGVLLYWARAGRNGRTKAADDEATRRAAERAGGAGLAVILPAIRADLVQVSLLAHARYAEENTCGTIQEMVERGDLPEQKRGRYDYQYQVEPGERGCAVVARYAGRADPPYPSYRLDENRKFQQLAP